MRLAALRARLQSECGFTLIEMLTSMAIMLTVMGGLTALLVSGTNAQADMSRRFQAQSETRLGVNKLRRDVHCSFGVSPAAANQVTLKMNPLCPTSGGGANPASITWCLTADLTGLQPRYGLWRYVGTACSGATGRKVADYLTNPGGSAFSYPGTVTKELKKLPFTFSVNLTPAKAERVYTLSDTLVLRNSSRAA